MDKPPNVACIPCTISESGRVTGLVYPSSTTGVTPAVAVPRTAYDEVRAYLAKIEEGSGAYSRDRLTHAENCITEMQQHARESLALLPEVPHGH